MALGKYLAAIIEHIISKHVHHEVMKRLRHHRGGADVRQAPGFADQIFTEVIAHMGGEAATRPLAQALGVEYGAFEDAIKTNIAEQLALGA